MGQLRQQAAGESLIARERVGLRERDEVLMPVQLPDELVISDHFEVEVRKPAPVDERRAPSRQRIELPVDRITEREVTVAEEIEPAGQRPLRGADERFGIRRPECSKRCGCLARLVHGREDGGRAGAKPPEEGGGIAGVVKQLLQAPGRRLAPGRVEAGALEQHRRELGTAHPDLADAPAAQASDHLTSSR